MIREKSAKTLLIRETWGLEIYMNQPHKKYRKAKNHERKLIYKIKKTPKKEKKCVLIFFFFFFFFFFGQYIRLQNTALIDSSHFCLFWNRYVAQTFSDEPMDIVWSRDLQLEVTTKMTCRRQKFWQIFKSICCIKCALMILIFLLHKRRLKNKWQNILNDNCQS